MDRSGPRWLLRVLNLNRIAKLVNYRGGLIVSLNNKLSPGDKFPELSLNLRGAGDLVLPRDIETTYAIVLFYRGHW